MSDRFEFEDRSLRRHAARGAVVNAVFTIGVSALTLVRGFLLALFLTRADYGVWGILVVTLGTIAMLKQIGIGDRFVQQDADDQDDAFATAFTLEVLLTAAMMVLLVALVPLIVLVYGRDDLAAPALALVAILPAGALQAPLWIHYRRMAFVRQRVIQAIDPVVSLIVGVGLAAAGAGYWAILAAVVTGAWATAAAAVWTSPYRLRLRWEPGAARRYSSFSWPILVATAAALVIAQGAVLSTEAAVGVAGVGALTLAFQVSQFADRVGSVVSGTLYPAICAARDRSDVLFESFVKSNRFALVWAMPFGAGLALFASDLVEFGIGEEWRPAVLLIQVCALTAAFNQVGFNWSAYYRARGETRPLAVTAISAAAVFLALGVPLVFELGLTGLAAGIAAQTAATLIVRGIYLARLFAGQAPMRRIAGALAPTVPAAAAVGLVRLLEPAQRTAGVAVAEGLLFLAVAAAATWTLERRLLREAAGYLVDTAPAAAWHDRPATSQ